MTCSGDVLELFDLLPAESARADLGASEQNSDADLPEVMSLLKDGRIDRGTRVRHDVLGAGWVQDVHAQQIRRKGGGQMLYARVALDIGQTCQFRSYLRTQPTR